MPNWLRQSYYSYKGLFGWLSWPAYISTVIFRPALNMAIYALVGKFALNPDAARTYIVGMAAYQIPFVLMGGITNCVQRDRGFGTLQFLYASRGSRAVSYFTKGVFHIPNGLIVVLIVLVSAGLFLGLNFGQVNWLSLVVSILIITLTSTAAALFVGNFGIIMNDWATAYGAFAGGMLALTGAIIPVSSLPAFLAPVSRILPLTNGLVAFRLAFTGSGLSSVGHSLLLEVVVGLGYALVGYVMYRFMEKQAKRLGNLDTPGA